MKDKVVTVRLRSATRTRVARMARTQGRSLSGQIERLIEQGLAPVAETRQAAPRRAKLAGIFHGGDVPSLDDFRRVRSELSAAMGGGRQRA
jgi:hypothetical protein